MHNLTFDQRDLEKYEPYPTGSDQYPLPFSDENKVVKLLETENEVIVASSLDETGNIEEILSHYHGKSLVIKRIDNSLFAAILGKVHALNNSDGPDSFSSEKRFQLDSLEGDAPIINFINTLLIDAIRARASDVHIENFAGYGQVRFRVDGALSIISKFPSSRFHAIAARIKIMANLNIMERRLPQDGRVSVDVDNEKIDLRVSIVPIAKGESIVLRLLGRQDAPKSLVDLGMEDLMLEKMEKMLSYPHGLILVTGPTGSGKTTTLNAMLRDIQADSLKIITIEDPIEFIIEGIDQIQVNEQIKLGFDTLLRRVLRQDPNVIMVGEVRDEATAELVVRAALTGHLVLSTLHTNDSISAISRLRNIGIEPFLVSAVLRGVIAQRLVRRLCPHCAQKSTPSPAEIAIAARHDIELKEIFRPVGCQNCRQTGYSGRFAIYEFFMNDELLEDMIAKSRKTSEIAEYLYSAGMRSLAKNGLYHVSCGNTTIEELETEVEL
ncbi:MAG: type II/IV secretion system protein [Bacilli bacterium]|nr:type II/IV secretion system protein [Bacilli bacterium]